MSKVPVKLRELVKQRLAAAAEEIFELLERTMREYEEETERQRRLMTLLQPRVLFNITAESGPLSVQCSEWAPSLPQDPPLPHIQEDQGPQSPHIKEEQEEESSSQEASHRDIIASQLWKREDTAPSSEFEEVRGVPVKSEEEEALETWNQPVHHNQTVDCPEPPVPVAPSGDNLLYLNNRSGTKKPNKRLRKAQILVKSHVCPSCGKAFPSKSTLEIHIRVHTGERPYSCSVCGKRFAQKGTLETHLLIHSGLKQFSCSVCGKKFVQKPGLSQHMYKHSQYL